MEPVTTAAIDPAALTGSMFDFARASGPDLIRRTQDFDSWRDRRATVGMWQFSRTIETAPGPFMTIASEYAEGRPGISLACQDYLALTSHPEVRAAAARALHDYGPHSAGSPGAAGNTPMSIDLERALGEALGYEHVALFPTGWAAGYGSIAGLVRPYDHVVMDALAHSCLQQGAFASSRNIHRHPHLDVGAARELLRRIRATDTRNGIMVITEGLYSMDSDVPDLRALQAACREYGATLLVDVAHDFGSLGPKGGGSLAAQGLVGEVDLVMGSFSKTFCSNGGFLASHHRSVRQYIKFYGSPQLFSNALSPVQAAVVREALRIARSDEGDTLRARLLANAETLRTALNARGVETIGGPSAIVPALIGDEMLARVAFESATRRGVHASVAEFPIVAKGRARFRLQLMPTHTAEHLERAATALHDSIAEARERLATAAPRRAEPEPRVAVSPADVTVGARALPALKDGDVARLIEGSTAERHPAGTILVRAGATGHPLYILRSGTAYVRTEHQGQPLVLAECHDGQILGEISFLDGLGASVDVVAATDVEVARVDHAALDRLAAADAEFGLRLYRSLATVLAGRVRSANAFAWPADSAG